MARERSSLGEPLMIKTLLAATMSLALMSGGVMAQSSTSSTTTQTTAPVAASRDVDVSTTTKRTEGRNGVMIEKDTVGTSVTTPGSAGTTNSTTSTTTVR